MTDRVAVNHAVIRKVNENWGKTLNELHCHLNPLDTIASSCRSTLQPWKPVVGLSLAMTALPGISSCKPTNSATKMARVTRKDSLHFWTTTIYLEALYHGIEATG